MAGASQNERQSFEAGEPSFNKSRGTAPTGRAIRSVTISDGKINATIRIAISTKENAALS
jgi:hypothetical protein